MSRFRIGLAFVVTVVAAGLLPVVIGGGGAALATTDCVFTGTTTLTLTADCMTDMPLPAVPDGVTVNGNGHTISVIDPPGGHFSGAVLTDATGATSMNIENLTIKGPAAGFAVPTDCTLLLFGILFTNASGTVNNVHVDNIFQQHDHFGNCNIGHAIRANGFTAPQHTVTITNTAVTGYQKGGLTASGAFMTMNASNDIIGPPAPLEGFIAPNGVQYGGAGPSPGAGGTLSDNTISGSGDRAPTPPGNGSGGDTDAAAVLLFGAKNVTVTHNVITGAKTDIGVWVQTDTFDTPNIPSTGIVVSFNQIGRTAPDVPDPTGIGIVVCSSNLLICQDPPVVIPSSATLICNTFSGWNPTNGNIVGAIQASCTPLPPGTCGHTYSANVLSADGGTKPYTWSAAGTLPPGLSLASAGAITGTPTKAGTFPFTATVVDSSSPPFTAATPEPPAPGSLSITINADPACQAAPSTAPAAPVAPITPTAVRVTG
jgi:hypothetical protein